MTAVRLPSAEILLRSPISPSPELVREVEALGPVSYLVASNWFHHLFVGEWLRVCPDARVYVAPGLDEKLADLKIEGVLTDASELGWAGTLDQVLANGCPLANEVVFSHRPSKTLVATDLAFNLGPGSPPLTRLAFRLNRTYGRLAPTFLKRLLVHGRPAFRRSLLRILEWPFKRIVVAHGQFVESGGREKLERGYGWLLGGERAT